MSLTDFLSQLTNYAGVDPQNPPPSTHDDFGKVAGSADQSSLASGLAAAFHSNQTPAFPEMLSHLFGQSNGDQRAGILTHLLAAAGGGGIAGQLGSAFQSSGPVTPEAAQQVTPENVKQLAEQAQQNDPSIIERASEFYSQHPQVVQSLGAGALALIMSHMSKR